MSDVKFHTRTTDEKLLMQFAEDQGFESPELLAAVTRLKLCHRDELRDYGIPETVKPIAANQHA